MNTIKVTTYVGTNNIVTASIECDEVGIIYRLYNHSSKYTIISPHKLIMDLWDCAGLVYDITQILDPNSIQLYINGKWTLPEKKRLNKDYFTSIIEERGLNRDDIIMDLLSVYEQMNESLEVNSILANTMSSSILSELTVSNRDAWDITRGVASGCYKVIQWPESQILTEQFEVDLAFDDITLINDDDGLEFYGPMAYLVPRSKLSKYNLNEN